MQELDQFLFHFINDSLANPVFDALLPYCREKLFWLPLYTFLLALAVLNYKSKALYLLLAVALSIGIADYTSSELIKKTVQRLRPCNDAAIAPAVNLRIAHCGSGYSFTSSHATNHFAIAVIFALFFGKARPSWRTYFFIWAGIVAFAQVYVGVHYPFDVFCGALVGMLIGYAVSVLVFRKIPNLL